MEKRLREKPFCEAVRTEGEKIIGAKRKRLSGPEC